MLLPVLLSACTSTKQAQEAAGLRDKSGKLITMAELDQLNKGYADRYMTLIVTACEALEKDNPSLEQRRMAHLIKLVGVTSAYDIVTNADPYTELLDLLLMVTLQSQVWIDDARADDFFKERADELVKRLRRARIEIWELAARVMTQEQLEVMDRLIWDWKRDNPDVSLVSFVRFNEIGSSRGKSIIANVPKGTGLLAPVDEATRAVDDLRLLAERGFYLSKRLPFLLNWQMEAGVNELLAKPEVQKQMAAVTNIGEAAKEMAKQGDRLPAQVAEERAEIFKEIDRRQKDLSSTLTQSNEVVKSMQELAVVVKEISVNLKGTVETAGHLMGKDSAEPVLAAALIRASATTAPAHSGNGSSQKSPATRAAATTASTQSSKAFDIEEYRSAAKDLTGTVKELNQLVSSADKLVASPAWTVRLGEINQATEQRVRQATHDSRDIVDMIFQRTIAGAAIILGMFGIYRVFTVWLARRAFGGHARRETRDHRPPVGGEQV